jgi:hypothetical protein
MQRTAHADSVRRVANRVVVARIPWRSCAPSPPSSLGRALQGENAWLAAEMRAELAERDALWAKYPREMSALERAEDAFFHAPTRGSGRLRAEQRLARARKALEAARTRGMPSLRRPSGAGHFGAASSDASAMRTRRPSRNTKATSQRAPSAAAYRRTVETRTSGLRSIVTGIHRPTTRGTVLHVRARVSSAVLV